ncbi:MAG: glycine cleavage system protein R [Chloroflexota bacterium]
MQKTYLVITFVGPDKPGTVASITKVTSRHQANIEESRMARLGGEFAVIMLISLPEDERETFLDGLKALETLGLNVFSRETNLARLAMLEGYVPYEVLVFGADHEGIVHQVAEYMASEGINIETADTQVTKAPLTGTPLFSMRAIVQAPPALTLHRLRVKLNEVGDSLGVDIEVKLGVR